MGKCIPLFVTLSKTSGVLCIRSHVWFLEQWFSSQGPKKKEYWKTSIEFNVSVQVSRWGTKGERGYRNLRGWMEVGLLVSQWSRGVG